ncbi:MAG: molybdenum cofactor cytidylyltransferase [Roseivirga sp.]|jgi:molybdenum cofactor cytidylyltransferase
MTSVSAILLAAGLSSRMEGSNKLLLPWNETTLIEHMLSQVLLSNVAEVVLVLGRDADLIKNLVGTHPKLKIVENHQYESGMTSSIQEGVKKAKGNAYMICLSDMPFLNPSDYNVLIHNYQSFFNALKDIILPQYEGKKANPVIFNAGYKNAILNHKETNGCSGIVKQQMDRVIPFEAGNNHFILDIDTFSDYQKLKSAQ